MAYILDLLSDCGFDEQRWLDLGLRLGIWKTTLNNIEEQYPRNVNRCLIECVSLWLTKVDDVDKPTLESLSNALRRIKANAVADKLDQESKLLILRIFAKCTVLLHFFLFEK